MTTATALSMVFCCVGVGFAVAAATREIIWGVVAALALVMLSAPLWQIAEYAEQIAQAKP